MPFRRYLKNKIIWNLVRTASPAILKKFNRFDKFLVILGGPGHSFWLVDWQEEKH